MRQKNTKQLKNKCLVQMMKQSLFLLAVNCLSTQLSREIEFDDKEQELEELRHKLVTCKQEQSKIEDSL